MSWHGMWDGFDEEMQNAPDIFARKPQTNYDRIRAMGIDHLIEWFCRGRPCGTCPYNGIECGIREWLNQEATDVRT